jgi:hypothetical protein
MIQKKKLISNKPSDFKSMITEMLITTQNYNPSAYGDVKISDLAKLGLQVNPGSKNHAEEVWTPVERKLAMEQIKEKIQEAISIANDYNLIKTKKTLTEINNRIGKALMSESQFTRLADTDEQESSIRKVEQWVKRVGKRLVGGTPMPEVPAPATVILDLTYHGSEIYIDIDGGIKLYNESADTFEAFKSIIEKENK